MIRIVSVWSAFLIGCLGLFISAGARTEDTIMSAWSFLVCRHCRTSTMPRFMGVNIIRDGDKNRGHQVSGHIIYIMSSGRAGRLRSCCGSSLMGLVLSHLQVRPGCSFYAPECWMKAVLSGVKWMWVLTCWNVIPIRSNQGKLREERQTSSWELLQNKWLWWWGCTFVFESTKKWMLWENGAFWVTGCLSFAILVTVALHFFVQ